MQWSSIKKLSNFLQQGSRMVVYKKIVWLIVARERGCRLWRNFLNFYRNGVYWFACILAKRSPYVFPLLNRWYCLHSTMLRKWYPPLWHAYKDSAPSWMIWKSSSKASFSRLCHYTKYKVCTILTLAMTNGASNLVIYKSCCIALTNAKVFIQDQGSLIMSTLAMLLASEAMAMVCLLATLFASLIDNISIIIAQCDCINNVYNGNISKVLSYNLYGLRMSLLCISICWLKMWLKLVGWDIQSIEDIENHHQAIVCAYHNETTFKNAVDKCNDL